MPLSRACAFVRTHPRVSMSSRVHLVSLVGLIVISVLYVPLEQPVLAQSDVSGATGMPPRTKPAGDIAEPGSSRPQMNLHFTHLTVADGLSQSDVRAIVQDRQGFMWFGTWLGGLNRYDGYTFKVYSHNDRDSSSLASDSIWGLYVDRVGDLWIGTNEGVDRYDHNTDSFIHFRHRSDDAKSLPGYQASSFLEDEQGTLWVAGAGGLSRFDRDRGKFVPYRPQTKGSSDSADSDIRALCLDAVTGSLWHSTWNAGVTVIDGSTGQSMSFRREPKDIGSLSSNEVADIYQDRDKNIWISTFGGLNRFDRKTGKFFHYIHKPHNSASLSDDYVTAARQDGAGRFWVATNNGLNLMDREHGTFTRYLHDPNDPYSLSSNVTNARAMYIDDSGALWIGMRSTGMNRLRSTPERFTTYRHTSQNSTSPSNNVITAIAVGSAGALWIGTEAGLDRYDGDTFTHYLANPDDPDSIRPGPQRRVVEDSNGIVWTGTHAGGLDRLDKRGVKHFLHDARNSDTPANNNISSIIADSAGGIWIGVYGKGLDYFDGRHFTHFSPDPTNPTGLRDAYVEPLLLDAQGVLWMASTHSGLLRFDTHSRKFATYYLDPTQPGSQAANWTVDVYSDGESIWVAAPTGLYRFNRRTEKFTSHFTEKDGLPSNKVMAVLGDAQGNLWVSTANGISRFNLNSQKFRNYDALDGLQGNAFTEHCRARTLDGRLYFGGVHGFSAFYPDKLTDNKTPPRVVLTDFELFNKSVRVGGSGSPLQQAINVASAIVLRHDQSVISFQFAALNYDAPLQSRYAYKLDGFDRDWQHTDATRRSVTYTNLDPGRYTFRVMASNNDGVWNEQGATLKITVLPPWWKTNWFLAFCSVFFSGLLWIAYRLRIRRLAHAFNATLETRIAERTRIARDLHDTLLQSFQGLLPLLQASINMFGSRPADALRMLEKATDHASQAITEGRDAIQGMRMSTVEKNDLALAIETVGEEIAAAQDNPAQFKVMVEGTSRELHPILRDEVYRLATEALRNSFRHAAAKNLEVEIRYDLKYFRLRVRDDGKGIGPEILRGDGREGHYGLHGMRERAKLVGGKLTIWTELDSGTEIELIIPAAKAYLKPTRQFWSFGKRTATETDDKETIERE